MGFLGCDADRAQNASDNAGRVLGIEPPFRGRLHRSYGDSQNEFEGQVGRNVVQAPSRCRSADILIEPPACDTRDIWHRGGAACDERGPGGVVQCLIDEGSAAGGNALDRIIKRQSAGLQQVVKFMCQFVGQDALQIVQIVEMHIESAFRDPRRAYHVVHRYRIKGPRRVKRAGCPDQFRTGARASVAADLCPARKVDPGHVLPFLFGSSILVLTT